MKKSVTNHKIEGKEYELIPFPVMSAATINATKKIYMVLIILLVGVILITTTKKITFSMKIDF